MSGAVQVTVSERIPLITATLFGAVGTVEKK